MKSKQAHEIFNHQCNTANGNYHLWKKCSVVVVPELEPETPLPFFINADFFGEPNYFEALIAAAGIEALEFNNQTYLPLASVLDFETGKDRHALVSLQFQLSRIWSSK